MVYPNYNAPYGCCDPPEAVENQSYSIPQKICKLINDVEDLSDKIDEAMVDIGKKEDSINITNNRKLSETGDFTGTWFNETKASIDQKILDGQLLYQEVIDLINSGTTLGITVVDGGFINDGTTPIVLDMGLASETPTAEIDNGNILNACQCI